MISPISMRILSPLLLHHHQYISFSSSVLTAWISSLSSTWYCSLHVSVSIWGIPIRLSFHLRIGVVFQSCNGRNSSSFTSLRWFFSICVINSYTIINCLRRRHVAESVVSLLSVEKFLRVYFWGSLLWFSSKHLYNSCYNNFECHLFGCTMYSRARAINPRFTYPTFQSTSLRMKTEW